MKVSELKQRLEKFQIDLKEHRELWGDSLDDRLPDYPIKNSKKIEEQVLNLKRQVGVIRPYLERFMQSTKMINRGAGVTWDVIQSATGGTDTAQIKGPSLTALIHSIEEVLGKLDVLNAEDEIPEEKAQPIRPGVGADYLINGYLLHLHPHIQKACCDLYRDGHYPQAIEEAVKAVMQYLRDKTSLKTDGSVLIDTTFSIQKPILAFSDLSDETKRNEQVGFMEMLKGFVKGVRHVLAHSQGKKEESLKAFEYVVMASLFCRRIDDAVPRS